MGEINLTKVASEAAGDPFWATRGKAIQAYATLEQSMCSLLATFGDISPAAAGVIFFKITAARSIHEIMRKLLKMKHGDTYSLFWNSLSKFAFQLFEKRNEIVHWNTVTHVTGQGFSHITLEPPNVWEFHKNAPNVTLSGLLEFIEKCNFASRLCLAFKLFLTPEARGAWSADQEKTWSDIFRQALVYPPPNGHPLFLSVSISYSQPPSSPESPNTP